MARRTIIGKTDVLGQELDELRDGEVSKIKLNSRELKNALPKIKEKLADKKLALVFDTNRYYFLNDRTMSNLMNGQIDENAVVSYGDEGSYETGGSDSDWVTIAGFSQNIQLVEIKSRVRHSTKSIPAGAYFKYLNNTKFDFSRYGVFKYEERNIKTGHFYGFGLRLSLWNQCFDGNALWKIQNILRSKGFVMQNSDVLRKRKNETRKKDIVFFLNESLKCSA